MNFTYIMVFSIYISLGILLFASYVFYIRKNFNLVFFERAGTIKISILLIFILILKFLPVLLSLDISDQIILTGSDQAFDHATIKYIIIHGHIPSNVKAFRINEYSSYPSIHLTGAVYSLITNNFIMIVLIVPVVEALLLFIFMYFVFKNLWLATIGSTLMLTSGYFAVFHISFVREVYANILGLFALKLIIIQLKRYSNLYNNTNMLIALVLVFITMSMAHYYYRYAWLFIFIALGRFIFNPKSNKLVNVMSSSMFRHLLLLYILFLITFDVFSAVHYLQSLNLSQIFAIIFQTYSRLFTWESQELLSQVSENVGKGLPEINRLMILLNSLVPLFTFFIVILFYIFTNIHRKILLSNIVYAGLMVILYYALLLLKASPDLYVVNIGMRGSQYILLILTLLILQITRIYIDFINKISGDTDLGKTISFKILILAFFITILVSVSTYPALLPPTLLGLEPTYFIPYNVALNLSNLKVFNNSSALYVLVTDIGVPESDLFRGFIYGLLPYYDVAVSRITIGEYYNAIALHTKFPIFISSELYLYGRFDDLNKILDVRLFILVN